MEFRGRQPREGTAYRGSTWNIGEYRRIRGARSKDRLTSEWEVIGGVHGEGRAGAALVWGGGRATRRGKLDGRGRKCEGRAEAHERGAEGAGLGGPGGGGLGCAGGGGHTFYLFLVGSLFIGTLPSTYEYCSSK